MTIHFERTPEHFVRFNQFHWEHSPAARAVRRWSYALAPVTGGLVALYVRHHQAAYVVVAAAFGCLCYVVLLKFYWRWSLTSLVRRVYAEGHGKGMVGPHEIEISPEGVHERTEANDSRWKWTSIERVTEDDAFIYIYTQPVAAHIIPKAAFTGDDAQRFLAEAQRHFDEARRGDRAA